MEEDDKACPMIRMGVSGWMFLVVPAYPGSPGQKAVKRLCVCVCVLPGTVISATFWCYFTSTFVILLTIVPVYKLYLLTYLPYDTHTNTDPFNGSFSGTTWVGRYQKGKTYLDFTEARDSDWQWHQMGRMQVCTSLQTDNHASTSALSFFTGRMPFLPPNQALPSDTAISKQLNSTVTDIEPSIFTTAHGCSTQCANNSACWWRAATTDLRTILKHILRQNIIVQPD